MARVTTVNKAQKDQGRCEKCSTEIKAGDGYKWIKPRSHRGAVGHKRKRCLDPETYDWDEDPEALEEAFESAREEWGDEVRTAVQEAIDLAEAP